MVINYLWNNDARTVLKWIRSGTVDAVITDAMYGVGCRYDWGRDHHDPVRHWRSQAPVYQECLRALRPDGIICWGQGLRYHRYFDTWFGRHQLWSLTRFTARGTLATASVWVVQRITRTGPEPIVYPNDLPFVTADRDDYASAKAAHPCPKSIEEMSWLLRHLSKPGDLVLDPYAGTGTTLVAAAKLRRRWLGIELSANYCAVAKRRLKACNPTPNGGAVRVAGARPAPAASSAPGGIAGTGPASSC